MKSDGEFRNGKNYFSLGIEEKFLEEVGIEFVQCLWLGYAYMEMVMMVTK